MRPSIRMPVACTSPTSGREDPTRARRPPRLAVCMALLFAAAVGQARSIAFAQSCVDYGAFAHRTGTVSLGGASRVALDGPYAYVVRAGALEIFDVSDLAVPVQVSTVAGISSARDLSAHDGFAYVAADAAGLRIVDVSNPEAPVVIGSLVTPDRAQDVIARGDLAYVACTRAGVLVVDLSTPSSPIIIGTVATVGAVHQLALTGNLVCAVDSLGALRIVDVSDPQSPLLVGSKTELDATGVAAEGDIVCVSANLSDARVIDISAPESPVVLSTIPYAQSDYTRDVAILDGIAYIGYGNVYPAPPNGVLIVDISTPASPVLLGNLGSRTVVTSVAVSAERIVATHAYYVTDGWRLSTYSVPASATVAALGVSPGRIEHAVVRGTTAYATNSSGDLLQVIDVADPSNPSVIDEIALPLDPVSVAVSGDYAYVTNYVSPEKADQLFVVDISGPLALLPSVNIAGRGEDIEISGDYAYVATRYDDGLTVLDISQPGSPFVAGVVSLPMQARSVSVAGEYAYVSSYAGVQVVDISNPTAPALVNVVATLRQVIVVDVAGDIGVAGLAEDSYGLGRILVLDMTDPTSPIVVGSAETPAFVSDVQVEGAYAYVTQQGVGVQLFDISNPSAPVVVGGSSVAQWNSRIEIAGGLAFIAGDLDGLRILPTHCALNTGVDSPADANSVGMLEPAFPNPSRGGATVRFDLARDADVRVQVFDVAGRRVRSLVHGRLGAGPHSLAWNGLDDRGTAVGSGQYLLELSSQGTRSTTRVTLIR